MSTSGNGTQLSDNAHSLQNLRLGYLHPNLKLCRAEAKTQNMN